MVVDAPTNFGERLASVVTIMKLSSTPDEFKRNVNMIHPKIGDTKEIDFNSPA